MSASRPLKVRAHHLLCMFGFRGLGYSAEFIANTRAVVGAFLSEPGVDVEVVAECDAICSACPHMRADADGGRGCATREGAEAAVRAKDELVLARLGLLAGERRPSASLARLVADRIAPEALCEICGGCRWLPAGYCAAGLARHRERF